VYGLTVAVQRAASIVLLPVYTRVLTPADYGVLQLLQISLDVVAIALTAGTTAGVMRFYFKEREDAKAQGRVVVTAWWLLLAFNVLAALVLFAAAPWIAAEVVDRPGDVHLVHLLALGFALEPAAMVPLLLLQAEQRAGWYAALSVARLTLQVGLNLVFLLVLDFGVAGVLASTACTNAAIGLVASLWMVRRTGVRPDRRLARDLLRFGLPYRVTQAGAFVLTFADRYWLKATHGVSEVGIYGLAYQFGFLLIMTSAMPFMQAWTPHRFSLADAPAADRDRANEIGFRRFSVAVIAVATALCVLSRPVLRVMSNESFHGAADLVGIVVVAYAFQAFTDAVEFGIQASERTRYATLATWIAVAVVMVLYAALIPIWGAMGAATATLGAFLVRFACVYRWSQQLYPLRYGWRPIVRLAILGAVGASVTLVWRDAGWPAQLALGGAVLLAFAALLPLTGAVTREEQRAVVAWLCRRHRAEWPGERA